MAAEVQIIGLSELYADFDRLFDDESGPALSEFKKAGKNVADPVAGRARSGVPYITGALAGSIEVSPTAKTGAKVSMGGSVPYACPVEFGGYPGERPYRASGRYLFPAGQGAEHQAQEQYGNAFQSAINAYPWRTPHA
jgi:hypothetical protein